MLARPRVDDAGTLSHVASARHVGRRTVWWVRRLVVVASTIASRQTAIDLAGDR